MAEPSALLTRLEELARVVDDPVRQDLLAVAADLRREIAETRRRADELANAQADAIVNAGMMMSELQEAHEALDLARVRAEKADKAKSEFLAHMSHEIRTPFNGVLGMNEILLKTDLDDHQRHCAVTMHQSAEALLTIINDILDFSKIEAGKLSLQAYDFDLRELSESVCGLFAERARSKRIELLCFVPADMPRLFSGDAGRLRQVLTNLLGNAVKFTDEGEVSIAVSPPQWNDRGDAIVRFDVTDTGPGILDGARERIFDPFIQADPSTERRYGGTGLGLAICAKLVTLMGGEIHVDGGKAGGTRFWFTVRLGRGTQPDAGSPRAPDLSGRRVLVVDDNATNLEICAAQLGGLGMRVDCVGSGADALGALSRATSGGDPFELAVLDMDMPGMNGLELSLAIDSDPKLRPVQRILLSSVGDIVDARTLQAAGIRRSVNKPVRQSDLQACVVEVLAHAPSSAKPVIPGGAAIPRLSGRILVAEDNPVNQLVARAMLKSLGLECSVCPDGESAVAAWRSDAYDAILMDCQMPGMDGYEATRRIRSEEQRDARGRTPIIALTANAIVGDREACLETGMDDYLSKPYSERALAERLARWLPAADASSARRVSASA